MFRQMSHCTAVRERALLHFQVLHTTRKKVNMGQLFQNVTLILRFNLLKKLPKYFIAGEMPLVINSLHIRMILQRLKLSFNPLQ